MTIYKAIKRSIPGYLILWTFLVFSCTIQAASVVEPDVQESYDYTLQKHSDRVSPIEDEAYLDIEDIPKELATIFDAIAPRKTSDAPRLQLLAMVGYDPTTQHYGKYLFASNGLLPSSQAQEKAYQLNYHLIKGPKGPVTWQMLSFLAQQPKLKVKGCCLPKDRPLCLPCGHMCMHLFDQKLPMHKAGCQGAPFPTTAAPSSAIACFYSDRFTDQQRRLVISQIGDKAFPDPKKLTTLQPPHNAHEPLFQPIQPITTQNQLHMAVQLKFPIKAIEALLADPQTDINTLDSNGKTPLDYAAQGSDLYSLLVGHDAKTSQQLKFLLLGNSTDDTAGYHSEENQKKEEAAVSPLPPDQLLIPANGRCLYTTIIMGYLLPVRQVPDEVNARIDQLFGLQPAYYLNELHQTLESPTHYLTYLHSDAFSTLVTAFMTRIQIKKGTWGGPQEIQTIATKLKLNIQAYYPDPSNPTNLVQSDLTKPAEAVSNITLHIVRDRVHPAEVLTQTEKASAEDGLHYQHYRLKYTLSPSISAPTIEGDVLNNQQEKPSLVSAKDIIPTFLKKIDYKSDSKAEKIVATIINEKEGIPEVISMHSAIHPLKRLLEDQPAQVAWQGWVDMAAYGEMLEERYVIVTIEGLLYTLQDRPALYMESHIDVDITIKLADYGFVLNIDAHKPDSFVLAQVNPNNTHTLTADNTFTLNTPVTDTLADELISYLVKNNVDITHVNRFLDWLVMEEMEEEALIADIIGKFPATQSNIYLQFPTLYKLIREWLPKLNPMPKEGKDKDTKQDKKDTYEDKTFSNALIGKDGTGSSQAFPLLYALRIIPHAYFYVDTQANAIYTLGRDTTLIADQDKAKEEKEGQDSVARALPRWSRDRDLSLRHRLPLRSHSGWARHTVSATQQGITIETTDYHLVPFLYQIAGDHTATTTCYCLVPPDYITTYQNLVNLLIVHQRMPVQQLTYVHSDKSLQDKEDIINWRIAKQKTFQVYFGLAPYFLQIPERILWQGWVYLGPYGEVDQRSYCIITDDDKLYTFWERPSFEPPFDAKVQRTIDMAHYSFVHHDPDDPNSLILSKVNPALQHSTADNTLTCYIAQPELLPTTTEGKKDIIPPSHNDTLLHTLRRATHQYYYMRPIDKQPKLFTFDQAAPLDTSTYHVVQISCQAPADNASNTRYSLFPPDYQLTYQAFAQLWKGYFNTNLLRLTHYGKNTPLEANQNTIYWDTEANKAFTITLSATLPKKALCRLLKPKSEPKTALESGKFQQKQKIKEAQKTPPRIEEALANQQAVDLFAYEAKFAKMNRLDLWALAPLQKLQDPRLLLKKLLMEVIENKCWPDLGRRTNLSKIKTVKYVTSKECPWLAKVEVKIDCGKHHTLGKPLNIAEMAAIKLYTDSKYSYPDLGEAQRTGHLDKWQVWDQLLMTALLKLHLAELHHHQKCRYSTYSGLVDIAFTVKEKIGFFKTYISTSTYESTALKFTGGEGMVMYVSPEMQQQFISGDVHWISKFGLQEQEILFARSADISGFPAPKWKATVQGYRVAKIQKVIFSPAAAPLIIPKGTTHMLPAQAISYEFSYIKIEENAILTIVPWQRNQRSGGHLSIRCYGDCILEKGAKIVLDAKGYSGGTQDHPRGYGGYNLLGSNHFITTGGRGGTYSAGGGSFSTQGTPGKCRDAFDDKKYYAPSGNCHHLLMLHRDHMSMGSGGGYIHYPDTLPTGKKLQKGAQGAAGGGALYLEIYGHLQLASGTAFFANGGDANQLTGGGGSGGTICISVKEKLNIAENAILHAEAMGGSNKDAIHSLAQGAGGDGKIVFYLNEPILDKDENLRHKWATQLVTNPPALLLPRGTSPWEVYEAHLRKEMAPFQIKLDRTIEITIMAYLLGALTQVNPKLREEASDTYAPQQIPHHVTITGKYYNAQGAAYAEKANYPQASLYYKAALALQNQKYGDQPHPDKADTLLHGAKVAAYQADYLQAIKDGTTALEMREKLYQSDSPAHTAIIEARNQLGWLDYQQGRYAQSLQRLEKTLELWKKHHGDEQNLLLVDTYNYIGLIAQSLGQYQKAIEHYHQKAQAMVKSVSGIAHTLKAATLHYIGQSQTQMGQYSLAIATHHQEMTLLEALHGQDRPHPDKARNLRGAALTYLMQGNTPVAMRQYRKALVQLQKVYGQKAAHPDIAAALSGIARVHAAQGNYHLASLFHQQSQTMYQDIYDEQVHHPVMADNLDDLGDLALQQQKSGEAMTCYQRAYKMKKNLYGVQEAHVSIALSHAKMGRALLQANQLEKALVEQEKALKIANEVYGEAANIPIIGRLQREIGLVHQAMHDYDKAEVAYKTSLKIYTTLFEDQPHPDTADTLYACGKAYLRQKMYIQALQNTNAALTMRRIIYQEISHHPTISEALLQLGRIHATQAQCDRAIHYYVQATRCQVNYIGAISDIAQNLSRFVSLNASLQKRLAQEEQPFPLHERSILPFLDYARAQVLLLHGDAGAGKSLYGRFLEKELWNQCPKTIAAMQRKIYTIPLFINLPALQDPTQNAILQALQQYGWDKKTIEHFKAQLQQKNAIAVIILDGYDEINNLITPLNLYTAYQLNEWNAKVVVTCRTEHLESLSDHAHYFAPDEKNLTERYIRSFDAHQIDHYLDKIVEEGAAEGHAAGHWTKEDYQDALATIPSLKPLIQSPFLLRVLTTILPQLQSEMHSEVTHTAVYAAFTHHWIQKELTRMQITGEEANQKADKVKAYAAALGFELFFQEEQILRTNSRNRAWQRFFADAQALTYLAVLPLRKVGAHQYQFIHKSYQEFFAAQHIQDSLAQLHAEEEDLQAHFAQEVKPYQAADREVATQEAQTYSRYAISCPPINQKLLKSEPAIIAFLRDGLWARKIDIQGFMPSLLQQWLFDLIEASKNNPKVATASSNAITLLAAGGISLGGYEWPHIQVPDAVLDRAFLSHTNLQGANLKRVSWREAYLEGIQCQHAQVAGLQFKEYPYCAHNSYVNSVSWSHDDRFLASASDDKCVRIWDSQTGAQVKICEGHTESVNSVSWSHDDRYLASASCDNTVRVWDARTGGQVQIFQGHVNEINSVHWSHDDRFLTSASRDTTVRVWDRTTGQQVQICNGHVDNVNSVCWSHDDRFLASASWDRTVRVWNPESGQQVQICEGHTYAVNSVSWSHDDRFLASASWDNSVRIWAPETGEQVQICEGHEKQINSVHWSHDDRFLVSGSEDKSVRVWDAKTGKQVQIYQGHKSNVTSVHWSHDGRFFASASWDESVRVWGEETDGYMQVSQRHTKPVQRVSWSHDDRFLASASKDNSVRVWDPRTGKQVQICYGHIGAVNSVNWSHDDRFLASASNDKSVRIWDLRRGKQVQICEGHTDRVHSVSWSHDNRYLASASWDKSVRIWDVEDQEQVKIYQGHESQVISVRWSHDDRFLASASADNTVRIWDAKTGEQVQICEGHEDEVTSVSWSHDDQFLASASDDMTVCVWEASTGEQVQICQGHTSYVMSVSWSYDDRFLASASKDKTVRIWDLEVEQQVQICRAHTDAVNSVSWSHNGPLLASAGDDKTLRVWSYLTTSIDECRPLLVIGRSNGLVLKGANFSGAVGLSDMNKRLIRQREGKV